MTFLQQIANSGVNLDSDDQPLITDRTSRTALFAQAANISSLLDEFGPIPDTIKLDACSTETFSDAEDQL
jgi:hypothetical protein